MPLNAQATNAVFRGLRCPYTDKLITVRVVATGPNLPVFFSPDAFDPMTVFPTAAEALIAAGTRVGVRGALTGGNELKCPYTGATMSLEKLQDGSGFRLTGGYSPAEPQGDPNTLARLLMTRDGVVPEDAPSPISAVSIAKKVFEKRKTGDGSPADFAMAHAEKAVAPMFKPKVTVTVPGGAAKKTNA